MHIDNKLYISKIPDDAIKEYSVYVGAYNISFLYRNESPKLPTIKMAVKKVIRVNQFFALFKNLQINNEFFISIRIIMKKTF
jgi:hypothetical protein